MALLTKALTLMWPLMERAMSRKNAPTQLTSITGYEMVPANNESSLLLAVANQPIVVSIEAANLMFYEGGVYSGDCGTNLDNVVTATGYGTTENGTKFWLLKNSWGIGWGEN
ncbi:hypothetical protein RJ640_000541 [Escallonia rubra]|uniref:Peptidase C1A papain C-terminal domain-containing protein n=1 Tax=Escallonia rubra TaxID=112253 RepID=A0AA88TZW2_9ASTE|nr:hypothetical protein RJ640_000541 [Escallonia rubra]